MGKIFGELRGDFNPEIGSDKNNIRRIKRRGLAAVEGGRQDTKEIVEIDYKPRQGKDFASSTYYDKSKERESVGYEKLDEVSQKEKLSEKRLSYLSNKLVKSVLGKDSFDREDDYPVALQELQNENNLLIRKINGSLSELSPDSRKEYQDSMFKILGEGSKDHESARKIKKELEDLYLELEDLKNDPKLTNSEYAKLYEEIPGLKEIHLITNEIIREISRDSLEAGPEMHEKYKHVISEELGRGTKNLEDAKSLQEKMKIILEELHKEIEEKQEK